MNDAGLKQHSTKNEAPPKKTHHISPRIQSRCCRLCSSDSPADPVYEECELLHLELTNGVPGRPHQPACGSTPRCPAGAYQVPMEDTEVVEIFTPFSSMFHLRSMIRANIQDVWKKMQDLRRLEQAEDLRNLSLGLILDDDL